MSESRQALTRTGDGWLATDPATVRVVLDAPQLGVAEAPPSEAVGTIAWLRASVSRFVNGPVHDRRRAAAEGLIDALDLDALVAGARGRVARGQSDRHVVSATLAEALGVDRADEVAVAVLECADGYFPGADAVTTQRADAATQRLVELLGTDDLELTVARIAVLVQACDATAALIGTLRSGSSESPLRVMRRVALADTTVAGEHIAVGDTITCDIVQAAKDAPELTFGHGPRSCPAADAARALAAGAASARIST